MISFLIGLMIGGSFGAVIMALFVAASRENYHPYREGE
jgi:gas vesicle protein